MAIDIVTVALSAAVDQNDTITVAYPDGTAQGDFASVGHSMWADALQTLFTPGNGISVSFGVSDITVTYTGETSIPANTYVKLQFSRVGSGEPIPDPTGGSTEDAEARAAISAILARMRELGFIASS